MGKQGRVRERKERERENCAKGQCHAKSKSVFSDKNSNILNFVCLLFYLDIRMFSFVKLKIIFLKTFLFSHFSLLVDFILFFLYEPTLLFYLVF